MNDYFLANPVLTFWQDGSSALWDPEQALRARSDPDWQADVGLDEYLQDLAEEIADA